MLTNNYETSYQEEVDILEETVKEHQLILYNDDVNSFEHVIECLIDICGHETLQAEQCAYLVHYTGKAIIKQGEFEKLRDLKLALSDKGLSVVVK